MDALQRALIGLENYDLLGPENTVEALQRLEHIAQAAVVAEIRNEDLRVLAQWVMEEHWGVDGLPDSFLAPRRAEVLLRLDTMFDQLQAQRRASYGRIIILGAEE